MWSADSGFNTGNTYSTGSAIAGTTDDALYQVGRYDPSPAAPTLQYSFTVPNGWYEVRLHFAEPGMAVGARVFSLTIEGASVFGNVDVAGEVGQYTALIKSATVAVTDGQLNIEFFHGTWDPFIDAIEILSTDAPSTPLGFSAVTKSGTQVNVSWQPSTDATAVAGYHLERCTGASCTTFTPIAWPTSTGYVDSSLSPLTTYRYRVRAVDDAGNTSVYSKVVAVTTSVNGPFSPIRVNVNAGAYTDTQGHVWSADTGFNYGIGYSWSHAVSGTSDPALYTKGRYDDSPSPPVFQYSAAVPNGTYEVHMLFAEPGLGPGARQFNIAVQGVTTFTNLDVAAEVGLYAALTKTATAQVTDGYLTLQFLHGAIQNPMISAIEVLQTSAADNQPPSQPTALQASAVSSTRIDLAWNASSDNVGTTGYRIERCQGNGCTNFSEVAAPTTTTFSNTGLAPATAYRFRLRAIDAAGNYSAYSGITSAVTPGGSDSQPPTAPASPSASAVSASQIALSWTASTDNVQVVGYRIERCQGAACSNFSQIATTTGTAYTDGGLSAGTLYRYRVRAVDAAPNLSDYSTIVSATTLVGGGDVEPPSAPSPLTVSVFATNRVDLSWGASSDNVAVTGYLVERCTGTACSDFAQIAALASLTTYSDTSLAGGTTYRYRVRARDAEGNLSAYSAVATATTTAGTGRAGNTTYQYDSFGRLKQVTVTPQ